MGVILDVDVSCRWTRECFSDVYMYTYAPVGFMQCVCVCVCQRWRLKQQTFSKIKVLVDLVLGCHLSSRLIDRRLPAVSSHGGECADFSFSIRTLILSGKLHLHNLL